MSNKTLNKVRLANGPHISPPMKTDILKRVQKKKRNGEKSSIGMELEIDWNDAKEFRRIQRNTPGNI